MTRKFELAKVAAFWLLMVLVALVLAYYLLRLGANTLHVIDGEEHRSYDWILDSVVFEKKEGVLSIVENKAGGRRKIWNSERDSIFLYDQNLAVLGYYNGEYFIYYPGNDSLTFCDSIPSGERTRFFGD